MDNVSVDVPAILGREIDRRFEAQRDGSSRRSFRDLFRGDTFASVSDNELARMYVASCYAALGGSDEYRSHGGVPGGRSMEVVFFAPDGPGAAGWASVRKYQDNQVLQKRFPLGHPSNFSELGPFAFQFPDLKARLQRFLSDYGDAYGRNHGAAAERRALSEGRRVLEAHEDSLRRAERAKSMNRISEKGSSAERYLDALVRIDELKKRCSVDGKLVSRESVLEYRRLVKFVHDYRENPTLFGEECSRRMAVRLDEELERVQRAAALAFRQRREELKLKDERERQKEYIRIYAEKARRSGLSRRDIEAHAKAAVESEFGRCAVETEDISRVVDRECRKQDAESLAVFAGMAVAGGTVSAYLDSKKLEAEKEMLDELKKGAVEEFVDKNGLRLGCDPLAVGRMAQEQDPRLDLDVLSDRLGLDGARVREGYEMALLERFQKVWVSDGKDTVLAGEAKTSRTDSISAVDVLAREIQVNASLLARDNPSVAGRYLHEAGVEFPAGKTPVECFRDAAARLYGDGGVKGAQRAQVFRESFSSSVTQARERLLPDVRSQSQTQRQAPKPVFRSPLERKLGKS